MDDLLSEKEKIEQLRRWWKENGPFVIGGLVLGVLALSGWNYYQSWQIRQAEAAKATYDKLAIAVNNADADSSAVQLATLEADYAGTPYLDQGRLMMAKLHADAGRLDEAAAQLDAVTRETDDPELERIARMRLARVLLAEGDTDGALAALPLSGAGAFAAAFHELRGDILARRGETDAAREEYRVALESPGADVIDAGAVQLKLDALGGGAAGEAGDR